jgi:dTDP-4-amino-4,6-dideoxygalactose transaminase
MMPDPVYVTQPHLPPLDKFLPYLERIWASRTLTNGGPFHQQLEAALCEYLGVRHVSLFTNGTIALVTALQALGIRGEVITTPYSFVATAHALLWNGIRPVFVDVDPDTHNLDPAKVAAAVTSETAAILPVHVYGQPCDLDGIDAVARAHGLRVIYDAAHEFGVRMESGSLLARGDLSVLSFHATKVFNTFEGGAIVSPDAATKLRIDQLKNFGFVGETSVIEAGINGKMSEFNAALGLLQLEDVEQAIDQRAAVVRRYREAFAGVPGLRLLPVPAGVRENHSYFPVFVSTPMRRSRDDTYARLREQGIFGRRYFFPLISEFPMYRDLPSARPENLPNAQRAAQEVLCLPVFPALSLADQQRVIDTVLEGRP